MVVEAASAAPKATTGLTSAQVAERVAAGKTNRVPEGPTRTVGDIVRDNIVTPFNILLGTLLVVILTVAPIQDALFGVVLVVNAAIGIVNELRAKRTLDRLALLSAPKARVVREGDIVEVAVSEVVLDDVVVLRTGDQVVVDGTVLAADGLEVDESLLTGESDPVSKRPGDLVLSGSFAVSGAGRYRATRVGAEAYAARLAAEAKRFTLAHSELREGINRLLVGIGIALVPTGALLIWSQIGADMGTKEVVRSSVAGLVAMVPQGLVLVTSMAFAVAVIRLGRRNVLVQELPAVEGLARVDTVCFDKTGTLTQGRIAVKVVVPLREGVDPSGVLGALAGAEPSPNATIRAIGAAFPEPAGWTAVRSVPFSSDRKWSAASFGTGSSWVLGAPELIVPDDVEILAEVGRRSRLGERVVVLAEADHMPVVGEPLPELLPTALIALADNVRIDVADTLDYFARQGVATKVISGDHPETVAAIARQVGVVGADRVIDGRDLPEDDVDLGRWVEDASVFGRVTPHQKRRMVGALQRRGHVVAMTGDGVNDVLALKDSDIGIAMGSGSSASRAVAQVVLLDGSFDTLPSVVGEGRRVIANIERVANLFLTKTVYAVVISLAVAIAGWAFPFLPRHLTLISSLTIGIPAFFLALEPSARRAQPGFLRRVLRFAFPTGIVAAAAAFAAYGLSRLEGEALVESRTAATLVLASVGFFILTMVSRPFDANHKLLVWSMACCFVLVLLVPAGRTFFELNVPRAVIVLAAVGIVAVTGTVMYGAWRAIGWVRSTPELRRLPEEVVQLRPLKMLLGRTGLGGSASRQAAEPEGEEGMSAAEASEPTSSPAPPAGAAGDTAQLELPIEQRPDSGVDRITR